MPTYSLHDTTGDLELDEHPAANLAPGDVSVLETAVRLSPLV